MSGFGIGLAVLIYWCVIKLREGVQSHRQRMAFLRYLQEHGLTEEEYKKNMVALLTRPAIRDNLFKTTCVSNPKALQDRIGT